MAKDRKKLIHIHSNVEDRQPIAGALEYGEIGINYSAGKEFISTKNSSDKVVRFSSDEQIVTIMEKKDVIPYSGTVDNINLTTNRSNIEIKLNQVVAGNTAKHDVVNGAKDIDGNLVNPTTDGGITNGAGFAINTSAFALTGGNPTFSSVTVNNDVHINGKIHTSLNCAGITSTTVNDAICEIAASTGQTAYKLTSASGDVKSVSARTNYTYDPLSGSSLTAYTPTDVQHMNRNTLTFAYAKPVTSTTNYDPGSGTVNTTTAARTTTVNIPNSISHLNEWDTNCLTINNNLCVSGTITTASGVFSTSDERKKHDIQNVDDASKEKVKTVSLKSFKFNDDNTDRKVYGVIAQDVEAVGLEELVHTDENGNKSVDYTSFLTLRIAYLEKVINHLHYKLAMMEQKLDDKK